jgi:uncharacterized RDD family membrane protein YckC
MRPARALRTGRGVTTVSDMSDDTTPPQDPNQGATPPPPPGGEVPPAAPPPAPPPYGGAPPPPPAYGAPLAPGGAPAVAYAEWPQRFLAYLIDIVPIIAIIIVEYILRAIMPSGIDVLVSLLAFVAIIGWWVYNYGMRQGESGYTLGKGMMGIRLVHEQTGQPVGVGMAVARAFVHIIDAIPCYVGYLWPLWDAKKQTFADKILTHIVIPAPKVDWQEWAGTKTR